MKLLPVQTHCPLSAVFHSDHWSAIFQMPLETTASIALVLALVPLYPWCPYILGAPLALVPLYPWCPYSLGAPVSLVPLYPWCPYSLGAPKALVPL